MTPIYLGVDIAGARNTWMCALASAEGHLRIVHDPESVTLEYIVAYCETEDVLAVSIDAQLSIALSEENGFRTSDLELRDMLPDNCQVWVASFNSLMAVPVRGRLLADNLSPVVGTLIETHPRASLYFALGPGALHATRQYKKKHNKENDEQKAARGRALVDLWEQWCDCYRIESPYIPVDDGALDALVCATVAHQFHHAPEQLYKLRHDVPAKTGDGPFYVIRPPERMNA